MKPYYYIFRVGGSHPRIKHPTLESAHNEAIRLASQHPGDSFEILQCLATTRTINPQTFWMDGVIPPAGGAKSDSLLARELFFAGGLFLLHLCNGGA